MTHILDPQLPINARSMTGSNSLDRQPHLEIIEAIYRQNETLSRLSRLLDRIRGTETIEADPVQYAMDNHSDLTNHGADNLNQVADMCGMKITLIEAALFSYQAEAETPKG